MENKAYIKLKDLEIYKTSRELSVIAWKIYKNLDWQTKKIIGDQFIESTDSIGANIAEGYGRYHFLDRIKFYYNARGSFLESSEHWIDLLNDRGFVSTESFLQFKSTSKKLSKKLNNFITSTYTTKFNQQKTNI